MEDAEERLRLSYEGSGQQQRPDHPYDHEDTFGLLEDLREIIYDYQVGRGIGAHFDVDKDNRRRDKQKSTVGSVN